MPEQTVEDPTRPDRVQGARHARGQVTAPIPVVLVARNNLHLTKLALRSVLGQDHPVEVLVVDNCSTDGTAQWLRTKSVTSIFPSGQKSLAWCWNSALRALWAAAS